MKNQNLSRNRLVVPNTNEKEALRRYKEESLSPTATWVAIAAMLVLGMLADSIWAAI